MSDFITKVVFYHNLKFINSLIESSLLNWISIIFDSEPRYFSSSGKDVALLYFSLKASEIWAKWLLWEVSIKLRLLPASFLILGKLKIAPEKLLKIINFTFESFKRLKELRSCNVAISPIIQRTFLLEPIE